MSLDALSTNPTPTRQLSDDVVEYLEYLRGLIDDPEVYGFACQTLDGIATTITERGRVTDGQRQAVRNIVQGGDRASRQSTSSRRYEGFSKGEY